MKIVIGLLSCSQHDDRDELVRNTWGKKAAKMSIPVYFLRGGVDAFRQDGDTLYFPVPDTYPCLPQKTRSWMRWIVENTDAEIAFKADNDSWICPERLIDFAVQNSDMPFWGNEPGGRWRGYVSGGAGYGVSRYAASILAGKMVATSGAEDLIATKTLSASGIRPFFPRPRQFISWGRDTADRRPRLDNDIVTTHQIDRSLWNTIYREFYDPRCGDKETRLQ